MMEDETMSSEQSEGRESQAGVAPAETVGMPHGLRPSDVRFPLTDAEATAGMQMAYGKIEAINRSLAGAMTESARIGAMNALDRWREKLAEIQYAQERIRTDAKASDGERRLRDRIDRMERDIRSKEREIRQLRDGAATLEAQRHLEDARCFALTALADVLGAGGTHTRLSRAMVRLFSSRVDPDTLARWPERFRDVVTRAIVEDAPAGDSAEAGGAQ